MLNLCCHTRNRASRSVQRNPAIPNLRSAKRPITWPWQFALAAAMFNVAACGNQRYAAESHPQSDQAGVAYKNTLNRSDHRQIEQVFDELSAGHEPVNPPVASSAPRWSDVPLAAVYACEEVEAAIRTQTVEQDQIIYVIETVEGFPGRLTVTRCEGPEVYRATVEIGLFGDKTDRAASLAKAFDRQMKAFAHKRSLAADSHTN
jgi:hypothetical protein